WTRNSIIKALNEKNIPCITGSCPEIYRENAFKNGLYRLHGTSENKDENYLPVARQLGETSIMFMVHPTLTLESIHYVLDQVRDVMKKACR
ncbi:MAG: aminotransferase, partial [Proteobacteria bacterium]|nr:aminotransferase [Pseudomonadota bacterium]